MHFSKRYTLGDFCLFISSYLFAKIQDNKFLKTSLLIIKIIFEKLDYETFAITEKFCNQNFKYNFYKKILWNIINEASRSNSYGLGISKLDWIIFYVHRICSIHREALFNLINLQSLFEIHKIYFLANEKIKCSIIF